jgi:lipid A 3-O-deacylase
LEGRCGWSAANSQALALGLAAWVAVVCLLAGDPAMAQSSWSPTAMFAQAGTGGDTHELTLGATWDWSKPWSVAGGELSGYWELSFSGWSYPTMGSRKEAWLGQLGIVPTFRYRPGGHDSRWFVEAGVGASFMTTIYETDRKRFSTTFNFADHIGFGRNFGNTGQHELALRIEHYSNAGIKHPNPGENFAEIRYAYRFDGL